MNRSWSLEEDGEEGREKALPSYDRERDTHKHTQ